MNRLKLKVSGMHCGHCRSTIEKALQSVPGTQGAAVFQQEGEAEVDYDPQRASPDQYVAAVCDVGYAATVID